MQFFFEDNILPRQAIF